MDYERPEVLDKLAVAYVLGTMPARARRRFTRLHRESPRVQQAVARWNMRLAPLSFSVPPVEPRPELWTRIAAGTRANAGGVRPGWVDRLFRWIRPALGFALGALVATAFVSQNADLFGVHSMSAALPASYVGILSDERGEAALTAGSRRRDDTITVKVLHPIAIPSGKVATLWAVPERGRPIAVGQLPADGKITIAMRASAEDLFAQVSHMGVSFEVDPEALVPSGPFVLSGPCVKMW